MKVELLDYYSKSEDKSIVNAPDGIRIKIGDKIIEIREPIFENDCLEVRNVSFTKDHSINVIPVASNVIYIK